MQIVSATSPMACQSLPSLLARCSTSKHISQAHAFMLTRSLDADNFLISNFILACSRLGLTDYAVTVFNHHQCPSIYLYNTTIKSLSQTNRSRDAVRLFNKLQAVGYRPDTYSFPFVLKASAHLTDIQLGRAIHSQVVRFGMCSDVHIITALIYMYSHCKGLADARALFDGMAHRDVASWNAMLAGYVKAGEIEISRELFEKMEERNVISWTTVIAGYAQMNCPNDAIEVFRRMQVEEGFEPDEVALLALLSACANLGALDLGEWVHRVIEKRGMHTNIPLMNALVDMYAKSGNIGKAQEVFESMKHRSVITWTTMISGLAFHGLGNKAISLFHRMENENVKPNDVTFVAVLSACCHTGEMYLGRWYFEQMSSRYKIKPRVEHYGCMIDLLGRAGYLREALEFVKNMPFEANAAIWGSLLAAARLHGNIEAGEHALRHLIDVEPHNTGNYTLLSNIYAAYGMWEEAGELRKVMKDRKIKKVPGRSSIEVDGIVHEFTTRDGSHPQFENIYKVLFQINDHLKMVGV